jgi:anthranilate synthase component 1
VNTYLVRHNGLTDLLSLQHEQPDDFPFLLQSAVADAGQHDTARYDILFAFPSDSLQLTTDGRVLLDGIEIESSDFLKQLDRVWRQAAAHHSSVANDIPFSGGWFLYLGYELAQQIEPRLKLPQAGNTLPTAVATRIPAAIINDHATQQTILVAETAELLAELELILETSPIARQKEAIPKISMQADLPETYLSQVARVKHYIVEGDVFQVNLSRAWRGQRPNNLTPAGLYARLCQTNPAPFAGLATFPEGSIISSSPERLLRIKAGRAETRPIAGTRPRSTLEKDDVAFKTELIGHPKERAEHIMLIDLERNDLGRVCKPGSVEVNEMMVLESYAHVHHIVSNVRGELRDEITPGQAIRAVFPGGTITGCPKERCMAIIAELEQTPRGAYTGSMGYLNHNGDMDLNILIRTISMNSDTISLRAGAGLVADSIAEMELEETCHKARGMLLALGAEP